MALPKLIDKSNIIDFLNTTDNIITDCDGVLWVDNEPIPNASNVLNTFRKLGKRIFYVSNNSTTTKSDLLFKCEQLGFIAYEDEIVTPSSILVQYLKSLNFQKKVYVIGMNGITDALELEGISHTGIGTEMVPLKLGEAHSICLDPVVGAVVVGFDPYFDLTKVMFAASYLNNPKCLFIATNTDAQFPINNENLVHPGSGVCVSAVETAAGRCAEVMGKPHRRMFDVLSEKFNLDPKRTVMIGDRCSTDILFGKNCGLQTIVVLSGITSMEELIKYSESNNPDDKKLLANYYLPSIGNFMELLEN